MMTSQEPLEKIGPGRLLLIVGPSGAGKDALIAGAKVACAGDPTVIFARRVVTRLASSTEDHDTMTNATFDRAIREGRFAFWWHAHGLKYGVPVSIDADIRAGCVVLCNVSRAIVSDLKARYRHADAILVTAPADVLAARLASRARQTDSSLAERMQRNEQFGGFTADHVIDNSTTLDQAVLRVLNVIHATPVVQVR